MGMREVSFPVFLRAKGDKEVREFDSAKQIENWVEAIDVENQEYEGWDSQGFPVGLELEGTACVSVRSLGEMPTREKVLGAFKDFAVAEGVSFQWLQEPDDLHETYQNVRKAVEEAKRHKPWWQRVLRRF